MIVHINVQNGIQVALMGQEISVWHGMEWADSHFRGGVGNVLYILRIPFTGN